VASITFEASASHPWCQRLRTGRWSAGGLTRA